MCARASVCDGYEHIYWLWVGNSDKNLCKCNKTTYKNKKIFQNIAIRPNYDADGVLCKQTIPNCITVQQNHVEKEVFKNNLQMVNI